LLFPHSQTTVPHCAYVDVACRTEKALWETFLSDYMPNCPIRFLQNWPRPYNSTDNIVRMVAT